MPSTKPKTITNLLSRMPYHLELGSSGHNFPHGKAIVVNTQSGKHYSKSPIPLVKAEAQKRVLEAAKEPHHNKSLMK